MGFRDEIRSILPTEPTEAEKIQTEVQAIKAAIRYKAQSWHSSDPFKVTLFMTKWLNNSFQSDFLEKETIDVEERGFLGLKKTTSYTICSLSPKACYWKEQLSKILSQDGIKVGEWKLGFADYDYGHYYDSEHFTVKYQIDINHPFKITESGKGFSLGLEINYTDAE